MPCVTPYLLAALREDTSPSANDITKVLGSVGIEANNQLDEVTSELKGKSIEEATAWSIGEVASVPAGGTVAVFAPGGLSSPSCCLGPRAAEEKAVGFGLFE
ncbi:60S acidic ribosomal protein P2-like [Echinops telfairi]|uniref:60S acidic ribosomal protein P2-like n=1 Tax=Echinops telfairi TaxID=9371 RepID=A0AC55D5E8_ECHTE|nr:60S acidic ribosomal protein P2-like [Echinops telfairi]